jgi:hypothetical protein
VPIWVDFAQHYSTRMVGQTVMIPGKGRLTQSLRALPALPRCGGGLGRLLWVLTGSYSSITGGKGRCGCSASSIEPVFKEQSLIINLIFGPKTVSDKKKITKNVVGEQHFNLYALLRNIQLGCGQTTTGHPLLFHLFAKLQPMTKFEGLLEEADNATVTQIQ